VKLRRTDPPATGPDTLAVVSDALLPMLWWRDVPVLREQRQALTPLERFVLETALALGSVGAGEFAEIVSLPGRVLAGGASRLIAGGALFRDGDAYTVVPETAARALTQQMVTRRQRSTADFVLLPRSGDLLAVTKPKGRNWLRDLDQERPHPAANAPMPGELWTETRARYLSARLHAATVAGSDRDVAEVVIPDDDKPLAPAADGKVIGVCPAYRCRAEVVRGSATEPVIHAVVTGKPGRRRRRNAEPAEIEIDLSGADRLAATWLALADALDDPDTRQVAWREIGPPAARDGTLPLPDARRRAPGQWDFLVTGPAASALAGDGRDLTQPAGLAVEGDEAVIELTCWFFPADDEARALYARDHAIAGLLPTSDTLAADLQAACQATGLPAAALRERIWQLGHYRLAYALREQEDFPHD
jgi:hypothetical protein